MHNKNVLGRRKYIRLDSVFPVEIYLPNHNGSRRDNLIQAFTCDVSLGGLCLSINDPDERLLSAVTANPSPLDITINMPISGRPIEARVRVAWHEIKRLKRHNQLLIGVSYEDIKPKDKNRIMASAHRIKWLPRIAIFSILFMAALLAASNYYSSKLKAANEELITNFHRVQEEGDIYRRSAAKIGQKYDELRSRLEKNDKVVESLKAQLAAVSTDPAAPDMVGKTRLEEQISTSMEERNILYEQLKSIVERKEKASKLLDESELNRRKLSEAAARNMYQWLKSHRNRFTGLVISFEGDPAIKDWSFTYDQSLACQAFLISGDRDEAIRTMAFFKDRALRRQGAFVNAYNAVTGTPTEEVAYMGPNIWIGIAAAQTAARTKDSSSLALAEEVAAWAISQKDPEGGMRGGPGLAWYSTEHNLDAYALFRMLFTATGKEIYRREMESTLKWIKDNTYSKKELRMNRGKGDSTIATDTLAWAIAAIGPETLSKEGMDPDAIMKFAEEHCLVSAYFRRPDGQTVEIQGFDFGKSKNTARGGIVSTEWTAQMVISYKIMADYHRKLGDSAKADDNSAKAELYLGELDKMVISSPSPSGQGAGCLPYASQPNVDTGHGWRTPSGSQTGSVSGTAYAIFAKKGYNPLGI